jgi:hypothetical protein
MKSILKNAILCVSMFALFVFLNGCVSHDNGTQSTTGTQQIDTDNDGIPNTSDNDIDGDGIPNNQDTDIDGDGTPNNQDATPDGLIDNSNTSPDSYTTGLGIVAVDTFDYMFSTHTGQLSGTISSTQAINLQNVRDTIEKNNIALSSFSITDLSIISQGSSTFIQTNSADRIVVTVSYFDASNNKVLVLESAAQSGQAGPVLTLGDLTKGITLEHEIFSSNPGFNDFTNMIKDQSKMSVSTVIDVRFLDNAPQVGSDMPLSFAITATGKKPF